MTKYYFALTNDRSPFKNDHSPLVYLNKRTRETDNLEN